MLDSNNFNYNKMRINKNIIIQIKENYPNILEYYHKWINNNFNKITLKKFI